jgi:hypothetical protein
VNKKEFMKKKVNDSKKTNFSNIASEILRKREEADREFEDNNREKRGKFIKRYFPDLFLGVLGLIILLSVDWRIAIGVFFLFWGHIYERHREK